MKAKLLILFFCLTISLLFASEQVTSEISLNEYINTAVGLIADQSETAKNPGSDEPVPNTAPTITLPDNFTFDEDGMLSVDFTPYVFDADGDMLYLDYYIGGLGDNGTGTVFVEINDLEVTFTGEQDWNGTELIVFEVSDLFDSAFDDVDVIVTSVNDAPTISLPADFTFNEDEGLVVDFAPYIDDIDEDALTISYSGNTEVTVSIDGTEVTFGATADWNGTETLTFTVDDGVTEATAFDDVVIIVDPVPDAPTITLPDSFTFPEDGILVEDFTPYVNDP
ncbi:MAG: hypothetical protein DRH79_06115, partial [Candidatus Cloacimonadota bacterium]